MSGVDRSHNEIEYIHFLDGARLACGGGNTLPQYHTTVMPSIHIIFWSNIGLRLFKQEPQAFEALTLLCILLISAVEYQQHKEYQQYKVSIILGCARISNINREQLIFSMSYIHARRISK